MATKIKDPEAVSDIKQLIGQLKEDAERCDFHYVDTTDGQDDRFEDAKDSVLRAAEILKQTI